MEIVVLAVGRMKAGPERELCERYLDRARKGGGKLGLRGFAVEEVPEARETRAKDRVAAEEVSLAARLKTPDRVVTLDAAGDLVDSAAFSKSLAADAAANVHRLVFVIGGPDGVGTALSRRADRRISFGRLTWPHQLVRILLAEQLYRATAILSGHPYHRA